MSEKWCAEEGCVRPRRGGKEKGILAQWQFGGGCLHLEDSVLHFEAQKRAVV